MTKLIVGLGNPGKKYGKTRHNVGFMALDALAAKFGVKFKAKKKLEAEVTEIIHNSSQPGVPQKFPDFWGGEPPLILRGGVPSLLQREGKGELLILAKPQTFMNESGRAVMKLAKSYKLKPKSLLVVHDEIDLPLGQLRISGGGSAGHKGADSILKTLGNGISRLRIGIENRKEYRMPPTDDYVLQNFTVQEEQMLKQKIIPEALEIIKKWLNLEIEN